MNNIENNLFAKYSRVNALLHRASDCYQYGIIPDLNPQNGGIIPDIALRDGIINP